MRVIAGVLKAPAYWRFTSSDPQIISLPCLPGWSFVNPLVSIPVWITPHNLQATRIGADADLVPSQSVAFLADQDEASLTISSINSFVSKLKYYSGQARLQQVGGLLTVEMESLSIPRIKPTLPEIDSESYCCQTAITLDVITKAAATPLDAATPDYAKVFLEAIEAFFCEDFKKLFYSARSPWRFSLTLKSKGTTIFGDLRCLQLCLCDL